MATRRRTMLVSPHRWAIPVAAMLAVAACGDDGSSVPATVPIVAGDVLNAPTLGLAPHEIVESTVTIRASGCPPTFALGTASVVDDGLLLTAAHTVAGADQVDVVRRGSDAVSAQVVWFDPGLDLAVLAADTGDAKRIPLASAVDHEATAGSIARIEDSADGPVVFDVEILRHVNIATTDVYRELEVTRPGFEVGVDVRRGDSGALITVDGVGVGVVWSRSTATDGRAWAVDLPATLADPATRATLVEPVDNGRCI
ncbi:MAG: trypsin-like peptidase domain-containing protein [Ilumatobacter sp.]